MSDLRRWPFWALAPWHSWECCLRPAPTCHSLPTTKNRPHGASKSISPGRTQIEEARQRRPCSIKRCRGKHSRPSPPLHLSRPVPRCLSNADQQQPEFAETVIVIL